jgi:hypothetical protein
MSLALHRSSHFLRSLLTSHEHEFVDTGVATSLFTAEPLEKVRSSQPFPHHTVHCGELDIVREVRFGLTTNVSASPQIGSGP